MKFKRLLYPLYDIIFPPVCRCCNCYVEDRDSFLCGNCIMDMPRTMASDDPLSQSNLRNKFEGLTINKCSSYMFYDKSRGFDNIVRQIKFNHDKTFGEYMGRIMGEDLFLSDNFNDIDYIVPVPLHKKRERNRGFNQSQLLALGVSEHLNVEIRNDIILRSKATTAQSSLIDWESKKENMRNAFKVTDTDVFEEKHILLIDDVITTGETIRMVIKTLLRSHKNITISVACLSATRK